jgi:hypothetical protein
MKMTVKDLAARLLALPDQEAEVWLGADSLADEAHIAIWAARNGIVRIAPRGTYTTAAQDAPEWAEHRQHGWSARCEDEPAPTYLGRQPMKHA